MLPNYTQQSPFIQPFSGLNGFQAAPVQQPQFQQSVIYGRFVNSLGDITAQDVPMDGTAGYFPTSDGSIIYRKKWNPDGTISTIKYVQAAEEKPVENKSLTIEELKAYMDERFNDILKQIQPKSSKKEAKSDE